MESSKAEIDDAWTMDDTNSPYAHVLHTNYIPSESQQQEIKTYISKPEAKLQNLEVEIVRMRAILEGLESEHAKLKQFVDPHKALLSPMRRLVPELLQGIFVRCLPARNCAMVITETPLLLTRICSEWRRITLSTPEIWSSLHIPIPRHFPPTDQGIPSVLHKAKSWLARSGTYPLSVSLYFSESHKDDFPPIIEFLRFFMHRFRCIEMRVPWEFLSDLGSLDSPILAEIMIDLYDIPELSDPIAFSVLKQTSSLRRVTLGSHVNLDEAFLLPLNQLHGLYVQCAYTPIQLLDLLEQCNNLREFSLAPSYITNFTDPGDRLITLPNLRSLSIHTENFILEVLLRRLVVPGLRVLIVHGITFSTGQDPDTRCCRLYPTLSAMITRSLCSLERFDFPYMEIFSDNLVECLSLMPGLTNLELFSFDRTTWEDPIQEVQRALGDPLLRLLTPTINTASACLLPSLQSIRLFQYTGTSDRAIFDFIHSRRKSGQLGIAYLTHVYVLRVVDDEQALSPSSDFVSLREDGLDITVTVMKTPSRLQSFDPWDGLALMNNASLIPWYQVAPLTHHDVQPYFSPPL